MPPPAKVLADALVRLIVPVPVIVRFVELGAFQTVPEPAIVQVPEPTAIVRVPVPVLDKPLAAPLNETLYTAASNVPCVIVSNVVML